MATQVPILGYIAAAERGPLRLPNLSRLGLPQAHALATGSLAPGFEGSSTPVAQWGYAVEQAWARTHLRAIGKPLKSCWRRLTVSDHLQRDEHMPADQREQGLTRMVGLVLDSLTPAGSDPAAYPQDG